ncbi:MAG: hypothetical protein JW882_20290 [Deltaproteobacteria bacterium]|nr:hypothetical protein [Deltaproteobacteria bacterium]
MRIMFIEPGDFPAEHLAEKEKYAKSFCAQNTTLLLSFAEVSLIPPSDFSMFSFYLPGVIKMVREAEKEGYDAVIIDCFTDAGLESCKITSNIPVLGPAETSLHLSCLLADRFGVITPMDEGIPFHWRQARNYGLSDRIASIKALNMPLEEISSRKEKAEERLLLLSDDFLREGAQLILVGCMGIFPALGPGSAERLSKRLGAPFIDPLSATLKTAEMLVNLNLHQSKIAFPNTAGLI